MTRPNFITQQDVDRWNDNILNDNNFPHDQVNAMNSFIKNQFFEVCYAGLYLAEELQKLSCPHEWIMRLQYSAGEMSFGRDPWTVHIEILNKYKNNELVFENDELSN